MRASEFITTEDTLNEVLPLVGVAAKAGAKTIGSAAARGVVQKATGGGQPGGGMLPNQDQTMGAPDNDNNTTNPTPVQNTANSQALDRAKDQVIRPGANVKLPTAGTGGPEEFKVAGVRGDEIEIENPNPAPGEPRKIVHKKDDIKKSMTL